MQDDYVTVYMGYHMSARIVHMQIVFMCYNFLVGLTPHSSLLLIAACRAAVLGCFWIQTLLS